MRDLFPGFYERTEDELSKLWQEATFIFDTNMLLNAYRYQEKTRRRFFEILEELKERIWTPHQAIYEYHNNRLEVISQQLRVYNEVSKALKEAQVLLEGLKYLKEKHSFIKIDEIIKVPAKALGEANDKLSADQHKGRQEFEKLKKSDIYREKITQLFQGRIGEPYKKDQLVDLYRQADKRFELQIPPGWKDKGKKTYDKYGDVILWFQLLNYARTHNKPIIFVTDDVKSDWFLSVQENNSHAQPRPELVQEMFVEAGVLLHIYQGYEFLGQAEHFLKLEEKPDIIADAMAVTEQNTIELNQVKHGITVGRIHEYIAAENAVQAWLRSTYSEDHKIIANRLESPDFIIVEPDGTRIGVEVKYRSRPYHSLAEIAELLSLPNIRRAGQPLDKFMIVLVCRDINYAEALTEKVQRAIDVPTNISLIIGYIGHDEEFAVFSRLP